VHTDSKFQINPWNTRKGDKRTAFVNGWDDLGVDPTFSLSFTNLIYITGKAKSYM
jgi:hypothetical protein